MKCIQNQNAWVSILRIFETIYLINSINRFDSQLFFSLSLSSSFSISVSLSRFPICLLNCTCFSANAFDVQFICNAFLFDARKGLASQRIIIFLPPLCDKYLSRNPFSLYYIHFFLMRFWLSNRYYSLIREIAISYIFILVSRCGYVCSNHKCVASAVATPIIWIN